jgi:hypothetical protein
MKRILQAAITMFSFTGVSVPGTVAGQVIAGRVVDAASGSGVPQARVTAAGVNHGDSRRTLTAADGRFSIVVRGGAYTLQVARTGYESARTRELVVRLGDTSTVNVAVTAAPRRLGAITATTRPRRLPVAGVFTPAYPADSLFAAETTRGEGGRGRVIIRGIMPTPTACWRLAGAADRIGSVITLNIQARPTGDPCPPDAIGASTYKVTLRRLPPGTCTLRVLHTYRDAVWEPSVALDTSVAVR